MGSQTKYKTNWRAEKQFMLKDNVNSESSDKIKQKKLYSSKICSFENANDIFDIKIMLTIQYNEYHRKIN